MRAASIDIGTNSCRLLIAEINPGEQPVLIFQSLATTRVGEGIGRTGGLLLTAAMARTVHALAEFAGLLKEYAVEKWQVVATAAVREAANSQELLQQVKAQTGLEIAIISGAEEALLSYQGVTKGLDNVPADAVIIDVGGGSTEFIWSTPSGRLEVESVPIGAVRATEAALSLTQLRELLSPVLTRVADIHSSCLIGTGGTATTLAAMNQRLTVYDRKLVHGSMLSKQEIDHWYQSITALGLEERKTIPGLQPQRADIIPAGIAIIKVVLEQLGISEMRVSETDLLWALLFNCRD